VKMLKLLKSWAWDLSLAINEYNILNKWGKRIGVKRKLLESNTSYRARLFDARTGKK